MEESPFPKLPRMPTPLELRVEPRVGGTNVSFSGLPMAQMAQWTNPAKPTVPAIEKVLQAVPVPEDLSMASGASDNLFQELHVDAAEALQNNTDYAIDGFFSNDADNITEVSVDAETTESGFDEEKNSMVLDSQGETYNGEDGEAYGGGNEMHGGQDETYLEWYKEQVQKLQQQLHDAKRTIELKNSILSKQRTMLSELSTKSLNERRDGWRTTVKTCLDDLSSGDSVDKLVKDICIKVVKEIDCHPAVKAFVSLHKN